ncbi:uncharacterized protein LOC118417720 isoform X1 [Branchiostoma floridae]|uniref:Uncharacterized protein LOC118417720 isoform X1 n=1 Tax=Branchiostoma floridae TaxID=7739 RepID=A0A9J7LAP1_BRAFL|nr:uncharacterized protein LOC118417720 isoform X1 [Branchiostoma floridae]
MTRAKGGRRGRGRGRGAGRGRTRAAAAEETEDTPLEKSPDTDLQSTDTDKPVNESTEEEKQHESDAPSQSEDIPTESAAQPGTSETEEEASPLPTGKRNQGQPRISESETTDDSEGSTRRGRRSLRGRVSQKVDVEEPESSAPVQEDTISPTRRGRRGKAVNPPEEKVQEQPNIEETEPLEVEDDSKREVEEITSQDVPEENTPKTEEEQSLSQNQGESVHVIEDAEAVATQQEPSSSEDKEEQPTEIEEPEMSEDSGAPTRRGRRSQRGKVSEDAGTSSQDQEETISPTRRGRRGTAEPEEKLEEQSNIEEPKPPEVTIMEHSDGKEEDDAHTDLSKAIVENNEAQLSENVDAANAQEPGTDTKLRASDAGLKEEPITSEKSKPESEPESSKETEGKEEPMEVECSEQTAEEKEIPLHPDKEAETLRLQETVAAKSSAQPDISEAKEEKGPIGDQREEPMESESSTAESSVPETTENTEISPRKGRRSQAGRGRGRGRGGRGRGRGRGRTSLPPETDTQDTKQTGDKDDGENTSVLEAAIATFIEQSSDDGEEKMEEAAKVAPPVVASKEDQEEQRSKEDEKSEDEEVKRAGSGPEETVTAAPPTRRRGRSAGIKDDKDETKPESSEVKTADLKESGPSQHTSEPPKTIVRKERETSEDSDMPESKRRKLEPAASAVTVKEEPMETDLPTKAQEDAKEEPQQSNVPVDDTKIKLHLKTNVEKVVKEEDKAGPGNVKAEESVEEQASPNALLEGLEELDQSLDTGESATMDKKAASPEAELWEQVDGEKPVKTAEEKQEVKTDVSKQEKKADTSEQEQKTDTSEQQKKIDISEQEKKTNMSPQEGTDRDTQEQTANTSNKKKRKKKEPKPDPMEEDAWVATRQHERATKTASAEAQTASTSAEVKAKPAQGEPTDRLKQTVQWKPDEWMWCEVCQIKARAWLAKTHCNTIKHIELSIFGTLIVNCQLCNITVRRSNAAEHFQGSKHSDNAGEKGVSWLPLFCEPCGALHLSEKEQEDHKTAANHVRLLQRLSVANQQTEGLLCCSLCEKGDISSLEDLRAHYQSGVHLVKLKRSVMGDLAAEASVVDGVQLSWQWEADKDKWYSFTKEENVIINAAVKKEKDVVYLTSKSSGDLCFCLDLTNMMVIDLGSKSKSFVRLRCATKSDLNNKDYTWQWQQGFGDVFTCWMPYMALHTILLEKASRNHEPTVQITTGSHSYDLDMSSLEHKGSKGTKKVQRVRAKTEGENSLLTHFGPPPEKQEEKSKQQVSAGGRSASTVTASGGAARKVGRVDKDQGRAKREAISFKVKSQSEGKPTLLTRKKSRSRSRSKDRDRSGHRRRSRSRSPRRRRDRGRSASRSKSRGRSRSRSRSRDGRRRRQRSRRSYSNSSSDSSSDSQRRRSRSRSRRYNRSPARSSNHQMLMQRAYQDTMMNARYLAQEKQRLQQEKIILEQQRKLEEERLKREWAALQDSKQRQQAGISYPAASSNKYYSMISAASTVASQRHTTAVPALPGSTGFPPPGAVGFPPPGAVGFPPPGAAGFPPPGAAGFPQPVRAAVPNTAQGQYPWSTNKPTAPTAQGQYPWSTDKPSAQTPQGQYPWSTSKPSTQTAQGQYPWSTNKPSVQTAQAQYPWSTNKPSTDTGRAASYTQHPWSTGNSSSSTKSTSSHSQYPWSTSTSQASSNTSQTPYATHPWSTAASDKPSSQHPWSKPDSSQSKWDKPPDGWSHQAAASGRPPLLPTPEAPTPLLPTPEPPTPEPPKPVVQRAAGLKSDILLMQAVQETVQQTVQVPKKPKPTTMTTWDLISKYLQEQMGIDIVTREAVEQILKQPALVERIQKYYREHGLEMSETQDTSTQQASTIQPASMLETQQAGVVQQAQSAGLQQAAGLAGSQQPQVEQAKVQLLAQLINMGVVQPTDLAASQPELAAASIVQAAMAATEASSSASAEASQQSVGQWSQSTSQTQAISQTQAMSQTQVREPTEASSQFRAEWGRSGEDRGRSVPEQSDRLGRRLPEDTLDVRGYDVRSRGLQGEPPRSHGAGSLGDVPGSRGQTELLRDPPRRAPPEALRDTLPRDPYRRAEEYPDRRDRGERGEWDRYDRERLAYERDRREWELYEYERSRRRELDELDRRRGPDPREFDERYRGREPLHPGREERERELEEWARRRRQFDPEGSGDPGRGYTDRGPSYSDPRPSPYNRPGHHPQQVSEELYDPEAVTSDGEEDVYDAEEESSVDFAKSLLSKVNVPPMAPELVEDALRSPEVLDQLKQFRLKNAPAPVVASYLQVVLTQAAASPSMQQQRVRYRGKRGGRLSKLRNFKKMIDKLTSELEQVQQMKQGLGDRCPQELHDVIANKSMVLNDFKRKALELEEICKAQGKMV